MELFAKRFHSPVMKFVAKSFKEHRVSHKRQGRKEFVAVTRSLSPSYDPMQPKIKGRLLGD